MNNEIEIFAFMFWVLVIFEAIFGGRKSGRGGLWINKREPTTRPPAPRPCPSGGGKEK